MEEKGTPLAYETRGSGHPLVLIHAMQDDSRVWEYQMDALAERFHVIRYDLRNHGQSPRCTEPYDAQQDLVELLDGLSARTAHLVGLDGGGSIALDFALEYPRRVSALVLAGSGISAGPSDMFRLLDMNELPREFGWGMPDMLAAMREGDSAPVIDGLVASRAGPKHEAAREFLKRMMHDNAHAFMRAGPKKIDRPAIDRLSEISAPTLIMVGDRDVAHIRRIADILHEGIDGSQKVVIEGAGSYCNLDEPESFNDTVMRFLSGIS